MFFISKNLHSNTLSCFNKVISKPKALPKQTLVWSKNNIQKKKWDFENSFLSSTSSPSKL